MVEKGHEGKYQEISSESVERMAWHDLFCRIHSYSLEIKPGGLELGSMNPTILEGDLVYVNKLAYGLRIPLTLHRLKQWSEPEKGDIVVLFSPEDGIRLVKRVIGVPHDEIEMRKNILYITTVRLFF